MISLIYKGKLQPYQRDKYTKAAKFKKAVMQDSKVVDFKNKVRRSFETKTFFEKSNSYFPLSEKVCLEITVYCSVSISLIDTTKAIMDALNKLAYEDDRQIHALQIKLIKSPNYKIHIKVFNNENNIEPIIEFLVTQIPVIKNIFPIRRTVEFQKDINYENEKYIESIKTWITTEYKNKIITDDVSLNLNFTFNKSSKYRDIDNIALCFITALENTLISDTKNITKLKITSQEENILLSEVAEIKVHLKGQPS